MDIESRLNEHDARLNELHAAVQSDSLTIKQLVEANGTLTRQVCDLIKHTGIRMAMPAPTPTVPKQEWPSDVVKVFETAGGLQYKASEYPSFDHKIQMKGKDESEWLNSATTLRELESGKDYIGNHVRLIYTRPPPAVSLEDKAREWWWKTYPHAKFPLYEADTFNALAAFATQAVQDAVGEREKDYADMSLACEKNFREWQAAKKRTEVVNAALESAETSLDEAKLKMEAAQNDRDKWKKYSESLKQTMRNLADGVST